MKIKSSVAVACFLPGGAKDLSARLYVPPVLTSNILHSTHSVFIGFVWISERNSNYFPIQHN